MHLIMLKLLEQSMMVGQNHLDSILGSLTLLDSKASFYKLRKEETRFLIFGMIQVGTSPETDLPHF